MTPQAAVTLTMLRTTAFAGKSSERKAAADRLGDAHDVGTHTVGSRRAAPRGRDARLHLVEHQEGPEAVTEVPSAGQVARVGQEH